MRISDWSSDVCSSDLLIQRLFGITLPLDRIHDTLLASRFVGVPEHEYDVRHGKGRKGKISPHSLAALGLVLGVEKQDFDHKMTEGVMPWDVPVETRTKLLDYLERSEEHPSELQSLMRITYAVVCLQKKKQHNL